MARLVFGTRVWIDGEEVTNIHSIKINIPCNDIVTAYVQRVRKLNSDEMEQPIKVYNALLKPEKYNVSSMLFDGEHSIIKLERRHMTVDENGYMPLTVAQAKRLNEAVRKSEGYGVEKAGPPRQPRP